MAADTDWLEIEGDFRAGVKSLREIANEHGLTEGAIRKRAKRDGWLRDPSGTKRERVKAAMSGAGTLDGTRYANRTLDEEAAADVQDMEGGLNVARKVIAKLGTLVDDEDNPRTLKVIAEANRVAIETIRKIRGLDDPGPKDITKLSDAELEAMVRGK